MPKISVASQKISPWIIMLLLWNIVLLSIALFYLFDIHKNYLNLEEISSACTQAALVTP